MKSIVRNISVLAGLVSVGLVAGCAIESSAQPQPAERRRPELC